jgi:uncharacterized protein (DUF1778 family)
MFNLESARPASGKMEARKELRLHREDEARIRAAAAATGLQEADFIRQAALLRAQEVERRLSLSILPAETFQAFQAAVAKPGKPVPGLAAAAKASKGRLTDAG